VNRSHFDVFGFLLPPGFEVVLMGVQLGGGNNVSRLFALNFTGGAYQFGDFKIRIPRFLASYIVEISGKGLGGK
jgi:hypothetical protein